MISHPMKKPQQLENKRVVGTSLTQPIEVAAFYRERRKRHRRGRRHLRGWAVLFHTCSNATNRLRTTVAADATADG